MINLIPKVNYIEKLKGNIEFSNYQIIIEHKYEKAALELNYKLKRKLLIDEKSKTYYFEFVYNKDLKEQEYLILMDEEITHIEGGSLDAFYYASKTLISILNLNNKKQVASIKTKKYYIEDKPRFNFRSLSFDMNNLDFSVEQLKQYIDNLSNLKINHLILKLSNEKSLLVHFRNFPQLCENSKIAYHEMKDLIRYAKEKFVYIIPEIDIFSLLENHEDMNVFYVIDELFSLFNSTSYIHFSGKDAKFNNLAMVDSVISFVKAKHHKKIIVYSDFINKIMDEKVIIHYYKLDESVAYINNGRKAIYSNLEQLDFATSIKEVSLSKTYDKGISILKLSRKAYKNILGMCGLYTKLANFDNLNARISALSEANWTNPMNHNCKDFVKRIK